MREIKKIAVDNAEDIIRLTPIQEGMLFHYLSEIGSELYLEQLSFKMSGELDVAVFKKAWQFVIENNEMLRTVFIWDKVEKPIQIILKKVTLPIKEYDLTSMENFEKQERMDRLRYEERKERIDIKEQPFRIILFKLSNKEYEMTISNHHILYDGWSNGIILKELLNAYKDIYHGSEPKRTVKSHYKEFVKWCTKQDKAKGEQYWKDYLSGYENKSGAPLDKRKSEVESEATIDNYCCNYSKELSDNIRSFAKKQNISIATLLYSAWGILLQRYSDSRDVVFGTTVSTRTPEIKGIEHIVGLFINTVPIRMETSSKENVTTLLHKVEKTLREREEFESTPLTDIMATSGLDSKEGIFDSIVVIENYPLDKDLEENNGLLKVELSSIFEMTNYNWTVVISTFDEIGLRIIYDSQIIESSTVKRVTDSFEYIIKDMIYESDKMVASIRIMSEEERNHILFDLNGKYLDYPKDKTIFQLFEQQVHKTPDNVAFLFENKKITYRELNERSNQLARLLRKKGVSKEAVVGVMMERSLDMVVSLMAILKAGGTYLPIDPKLPAERILYMLEDSKAVIVLTSSKGVSSLHFSDLQNFTENDINIIITEPRGHIKDFDNLPIPDRTLINLNNYKNKIGMASVNNCISIQTTRGCPYNCLYCHKIWSKHHVNRSAESIYSEIDYFYKNGVTNFAVIDDCFNINVEESSKLFRLIIKNKLKLQLFFPNGLRGDILTQDYIDLMVEAGTRGVNLSLETASPRLQKLLNKNLDLEKFRSVLEYISTKHPGVILELATMHGFPTETPEEAMLTLDFIKSIKWLHFPYVHILKIFPNTEMEAFALEHGISKEDILKSKDRAFHELPETLPFPKSFTRKYQANFMNEYFLSKERLRHVLPIQLRILEKDALVQKYNAYLPVEIKSVEDIIKFAEIEDFVIPENYKAEKNEANSIFDQVLSQKPCKEGARKILFLDLSQHFSSQSMLYKVAEQPLGQIYLLTYLKQQYGDRIDGKILKSGNDFESFDELRTIVNEYKPELIGIRTLTYFKEFFHETVSLLRQWGIEAPIITGGPYASSDYDTILKDRNINLVIFGEGEYTLSELVGKMLEIDFKLPGYDVLKDIKGIAYTENTLSRGIDKSREVILVDKLGNRLDKEAVNDLEPINDSDNLAYVMYTSGSTGKPKGVMVEHRNVNNCIYWMQKEFALNSNDVILQRTNLTFDPSVWEIFWPLFVGAGVKLITEEQSRDAEFLIELMAKDSSLTMMYCPASLINAMTYILNSKIIKPRLKTPWLIIGAESVSSSVIADFYKYYTGRIVNTYGPTECTINNTYFTLEPGSVADIIPIGKPIDNNQIYMLSTDLEPMPLKAYGEIYISGDSVSRGYMRDDLKTEQSFLDNPFGQGKLYKTGDMGRWMENGSIEILGRKDEQVKIRGFRIELGEIENAILSSNSVKDCVVVAKDSTSNDEEIRVCNECGITSKYPNISIGEDKVCNICKNADKYIEYAKGYFKTLEDFKSLILEENKDNQGKYDFMLVYSCERVATYALYKLVEMGFKVLTATYDPGHISEATMANIKKTTEKIGVDHVVLTHRNSNQILKESLKSAKTMCKGCIHTSTALAGEYAYKNGIKMVIGETLSRGQIIENKLYKFFKQGIYEVEEIEKGLMDIQNSVPDIDKNIFDCIDIAEIKDRELYDKVKFVDFYRYCDVSNEEMIAFLNNQDAYWENLGTSATYSTDCFICQVGDYNFYQENGYHYNGGAKSWEKRLGQITLEELREELRLKIKEKEVENFLDKIDYKKEALEEKLDSKYLCAYVVAEEGFNAFDLKEYLKEKLPVYMLPSNYVVLDKIPLTTNGKVDKKALPEPEDAISTGHENVLPSNETEEKLVQIWRKVLTLENVGVEENFFDLGGNSLLLVQLYSQIERLYPGEISITDLFSYTTVSRLAEFIIGKTEKYGGKKLELKTVEFPEEFFFENSELDESAVFKVKLKKQVVDNIMQISKAQGISVYNILLGIHIYLISEITQQKNVIVQAMITNNTVRQIEVDFDKLNGFLELFEVVSQKRMEKDYEEIYSIKDIERIVVNKSKPNIIPLIYARDMLMEELSLLEIYDIVLEINIDPEEISFSYKYDGKCIKRENVKELLSSYVEIIEGFADKNKA